MSSSTTGSPEDVTPGREAPADTAELTRLLEQARAERDQLAQRVAALQASEVDERRRSELERQLIGIVSHDLRNPLQVIRFSAALGGKGAGDAKLRKHFERILTSSDRALGMINALLDFTRIRFDGDITLEPGQHDLHTLTAQVVDEVLVTRPERHVIIERSGDGRGQWDADRLGQVVQNLVGNALQHTTEDTEVRVRTRGEADVVVLEVHNGGTPIAAEQLPTLFEPFQRGKSARGGQSLGLGLHIASHIVKAHGGSLKVRSTAEEGTTFSVSLPRILTKHE